MSLLTIIGCVGAVAVLYGFTATSSGRLSHASTHYHLLNLGGGSALLLSAIGTGAWPSAVTSSAWAIVSITALGSALRARRRSRPCAIEYEPPTAELSLPTGELALR